MKKLNKINKGSVELFVVLGLLVIAAALPVAVSLVKRTQELRRGAATPIPTPTQAEKPLDSVPPAKAVIKKSFYDPKPHKAVFQWSWQGDYTCANCEPRVGWCEVDLKNALREDGSIDWTKGRSKGLSKIDCDPTQTGPFWWEVRDETADNEMVVYYHSGRVDGHSDPSVWSQLAPPGGFYVGVVDGNAIRSEEYPPGGTKIAVPCEGREGHNLKLFLATRDARGNMKKSEEGYQGYEVVEASVVCGTATTSDFKDKIGGYVWVDRNNNGKRDADEGIRGVRIALYKAEDYEREGESAEPLGEATTIGSGWYDFAQLGVAVVPGDYVVSERQPEGYQSITPDVVWIRVREDGTVVRVTEEGDEEELKYGTVNFEEAESEVTQEPALCGKKEKGDANCDDLVDLVDYSIWLNSQCLPQEKQACGDLRADFDRDGDVDIEDYGIWKENFVIDIY